MKEILKKAVVVIPSLGPDDNMLNYVNELIEKGFSKILLINDGSDDEDERYYRNLLDKHTDVIHYVKHNVNEGKGRALKTGFHYILNTFTNDEITGVVTADADGQHSVKDTINVALKLIETETYVLGCRNFNAENIPPKSEFGNKVTTFVFKQLYGKKITDTQTGLRGLPFNELKFIIPLIGEKFDYEINMLIHMVTSIKDIEEVEIDTIYFDSNRATHFDAVKDSIKIYKIMFKQFFLYTGSGLLSFIVDVSFFTLFITLFGLNGVVTQAIFLSTLLARILSSLLNYNLNKNVVFKNSENNKTIFVKYYALCIMQMLLSWFLVSQVFTRSTIYITLIKIFIDILLFLISFQIQKKWVFIKGAE